MDSNDRQVINKSLFMVIMTAVGLFCVAMFLSNSWIKIVTFVLIVAIDAVWLVSHGLLQRTLKYALFAVMIFSISFSAFEGYVFWNAGYPPTFGTAQPDVTLSYPNILNTSLTEVVQSAKNTLAFKLFMLEHPGEVIVEFITLDTSEYMGRRIELCLSQQSSNQIFNFGETGIVFSASNGEAYHAHYLPTVTLLLTDKGSSVASRTSSQQQTTEKALQQIDALGLQWYYDRVIEAYQNKKGITPEVNSLNISFFHDVQLYDNGVSYEVVMELTITGSWYSNAHPSSFYASFQPDGTLNFINILN